MRSGKPVSEYPKLTRDEENRLIERWQRSGDQGAAAQLVEAHQRTVAWLANKYRDSGVPYEELVAEGNLGLVIALNRFQIARGHRFITYAVYWMRACMLSHGRRHRSMVSTGRGSLRSQLAVRVRRERARLEGLHGPGPRVQQELAQFLGVSPDEVSHLLARMDQRDVSLEGTSAVRGSQITLMDTLRSPAPDQEEQLADRDARERAQHQVRAALPQLKPRERYVLENRVMADDDDAATLAELGRRMGVSRERARQIEDRAIHKLRKQISTVLPPPV